MAGSWLFGYGIATHLGVAKNTVRSSIAEMGMSAHKLDFLWKFQASEVDEWVRSGGAASSSKHAIPTDRSSAR
ncbi:helix-turn-helix domain-containing protein [Catellatospora sp. NPDC049133]|uniref:helix-turn-helix domain-containing protein n=1 Tax=Catellatospora sp. NPDC049133 TaxID=3155499 RepID=UPI0033FCA85A